MSTTAVAGPAAGADVPFSDDDLDDDAEDPDAAEDEEADTPTGTLPLGPVGAEPLVDGHIEERVLARRWVELAACSDGEHALSGLVNVLEDGIEATDGYRVHEWKGEAGVPGIEPVLTRKARLSPTPPLLWPHETAVMLDKAMAGTPYTITDPLRLYRVCRQLRGRGRYPLAPALIAIGRLRIGIHPGDLADAMSWGGAPTEEDKYQIIVGDAQGPVAVINAIRETAIAVIQPMLGGTRGWTIDVEMVGGLTPVEEA